MLDWSAGIADLAIKYKDRQGVSVVGVDIAGDELAPMNQEHIDAFKVTLTHALTHTCALKLSHIFEIVLLNKRSFQK